MIQIFFLYFLIASTFTIAKAALSIFQPIFFIGLRMTIAGSLLLGYLYWFKPSSWRLPRQHRSLFARIILLHIYAAYVLEFIGLQVTSSSKVCFLYNLTPFITALLAYWLLGERLTHRRWWGLIIGFLGAVPLIMQQMPGIWIDHLSFVSWADCALLGSVVASAYGWIVMKELVAVHHYSPIMVNGIGMIGGGLLALITSCMVEGFPPTLILAPDAAWLPTLLEAGFYMSALIIIGNIIAYNLYGYLLKEYSPTILSYAGFSTPLFAALLGWFFLGEIPTINFYSAFLITGVGMWLFYAPQEQKGIS